MNIQPDSIYDLKVAFGDDENATLKLGGGTSINILSGRASVHLGRDGLHSWDKPTFFQPNEEHDGFVTMTTSSGLNVFLSIEQATAIALAVEEGKASGEIGLSHV